MNPALETLIQIQDLDLMLRELGDDKTASAEKKLGFQLDGIETLQKTRKQLAGKVKDEWLRLYERINQRHIRAIVLLRDGICYGCFVRQPERKSVDSSVVEDELEICQRCGRILFRSRFR